MSKQFLKNLLNPGVNSSNLGGTPEVRARVREFMSQYGMSESMVYTRMLRVGYGSGFDKWELQGIRSIIKEYAELVGMDELTEAEYPTFYENIPRKEDFWTYMGSRGMGKNACIYRFREFNFKEWELIGAAALINKLLEEE